MDNHFKFTNSVVAVPLFLFLSLFIMETDLVLILIKNGFFLEHFGLQGVFFSPFIHSDLNHLYNNSMPLLVLLAFFYQAFPVIAYGILFSGILTWLIGRSSYHIGASGLVYVLVSFIFLLKEF
jgi:membrane associated rhomboid family serine protease